MTVADMYRKIDRLIEKAFAQSDTITRANYIALRKAVLTEVKSLWDKAAIAATTDPLVGNVRYVSKMEAFKYGRFENMAANLKAEIKRQALIDIHQLERLGVSVYSEQYNGYAWAYQQGYGLPVKGGARIKLVANALYSDFYGKPMDKTIRANLGAYAQSVIDAATRGLNQGFSYAKIAKQVSDITNKSYASALRVARTEAGRVQSQAYVDGLALLDEVGAKYEKIWQSTIDTATRDDHAEMDGEPADKDGIFTLPDGSTGTAPRMTGEASQDINCRCGVITVINGEKPSERRIRGEGIVPYETFKERLERKADIPILEVRKARSA